MTNIRKTNTETDVSGVCGGSASGKTTVAKRIIEALDVQWVSLLSMDSFYKVIVTTHARFCIHYRLFQLVNHTDQ